MKFQENCMLLKSNSYILSRIQDRLRIFIFYILKIFPINDKKIVVQCFKDMGYCDSPKYICEELLYQKTDYQIVWITKKDYINQFPAKIKPIPVNTFRAIRELATAKIWIDNCRKSSWVRKRPGQFYLQTWHNGISLKKVEGEAVKVLSESYLKAAKNDSKMINAFLSNSDFATNRIKNSFWYSNKILEFGLPKNDIFFKYSNDIFRQNIKRKVSTCLGIPYENSILLYAPTFRHDFSTETYLKDYSDIIKALNKKTEWTIVEHFHPNVQHFNVNSNHSEGTINADTYEDFQELLLVSDILITDYSSTMFEFSIMKKPVFLFTPDSEAYKKDRNFTFHLEDLPWTQSKTPQDLAFSIERFNNELYLDNLEKFMQNIRFYETGTASKKVVELLKNRKAYYK